LTLLLRLGLPLSQLFLGRCHLRATDANAGSEMFIQAIRHKELRVLGPAVASFGQADFLFAKRIAVGFGGVLSVRRAIADMAVENDEGGPAFRQPEYRESVLEAVNVVGITDAQDVPIVGEESRGIACCPILSSAIKIPFYASSHFWFSSAATLLSRRMCRGA